MSDEEPSKFLRLEVFVQAEPWMDKANCKGLGADAFILERGASPDIGYAACNGCTVRSECKSFQRRTGSVGIWGGELTSEPPTEQEIANANQEHLAKKSIIMRRRRA